MNTGSVGLSSHNSALLFRLLPFYIFMSKLLHNCHFCSRILSFFLGAGQGSFCTNCPALHQLGCLFRVLHIVLKYYLQYIQLKSSCRQLSVHKTFYYIQKYEIYMVFKFRMYSLNKPLCLKHISALLNFSRYF